jgi:hypothetical protein
LPIKNVSDSGIRGFTAVSKASETAFSNNQLMAKAERQKTPHPPLRGDLSPQERGEVLLGLLNSATFP